MVSLQYKYRIQGETVVISIYDVVFEAVNFRHAFTGAIKQLEHGVLDYIPSSYDANAYFEATSLALRVAIRMLYRSKGYSTEAYGDLMEEAKDRAEDGFIPYAMSILSTGKEDDVIITLGHLLNELHPENYSFLSTLNMQIYNDRVLHDTEEFIRAVKALIESLSYFESVYGELPFRECEFPGAYNDIVTSSYAGMPLFLINNTLWFIDSSNHGSKWQVGALLVSYVMCIHSDISNENKIQWLASYNPITNCIQMLDVSKIDKRTFTNICKRYIGYIMPEEGTDRKHNDWRFSSGTDPDRYKSAYHFHKESTEAYRKQLLESTDDESSGMDENG